MNQSIDGTRSAARSSRASAVSAATSRRRSLSFSESGGVAGGRRKGTKASTASPARVVRSYLPVFLVTYRKNSSVPGVESKGNFPFRAGYADLLSSPSVRPSLRHVNLGLGEHHRLG